MIQNTYIILSSWIVIIDALIHQFNAAAGKCEVDLKAIGVKQINQQIWDTTRRYGIFGAAANIQGQENLDIQYINWMCLSNTCDKDM